MHVGIVGRGVSGLCSALMLLEKGISVTLLEGTEHLGGRVYTVHFTPRAPDEDPYFEAGAMRIPCSSVHRPVFDLVKYLNRHVSSEMKIKLIPYIMTNENNMLFIRGKERRADDRSLAEEFGLPEEYWNRSAKDLLRGVVGEWVALSTSEFEHGFEIVLEYDEWSFRQYLRQIVQWPHAVIDFVEIMTSQTSQYDLSFTELILQHLDFGTKDWVTIEGGMSRLVDSAADLVEVQNIHMNSPIKGIRDEPDGKVSLFIGGASSRSVVFDNLILAIPLPSLKAIPNRPHWEFSKEQAIGGAYYEPLYKMGLKFRTRFWERFSRPCFGGQSTSDLRVRWVIPPSNDLGSSGSGVLLVYCWMTDAARWSAMQFEDRIK
ncbi:flavin-containing amine oxidase [Penicillium lividum]|nr:flavin-containing amine oxidase [Penicillium lividum]